MTIHEQQAQDRRAALAADYRARTAVRPHSTTEFVLHLLTLVFLLLVAAMIAVGFVQQVVNPPRDWVPIGNQCYADSQEDHIVKCPEGTSPPAGWTHG